MHYVKGSIKGCVYSDIKIQFSISRRKGDDNYDLCKEPGLSSMMTFDTDI